MSMTPPMADRPSAKRWAVTLSFVRRELRSGVRGFRIFLACLALGIAALAAAGSTAEAFRQGLASQARSILGGDIAASLEGRRFTATEQAAFAKAGATTDTLLVRAMAEGPKGRRLAEVRGVDPDYPLSGRVDLEGGQPLSAALEPVGALPGAAVEPELLDRLGLRVGDTLLVGDLKIIVRGVMKSEPDKLGRGFSLGPEVMIARSALERSGLVAADSLFGETVRIALPADVKPEPVIKALHQQFPDGGFRLRGRKDAAAGLGRLIDQLEFFLSFIGLAALLAGGLGVSSAVSSYLDARKPSIAVLKALGADGAMIRNIYMIQIALLASLGIGIGLAIGAASPFVLGWIARNRLPVPVLFALYPAPLIRAGLFGALAAAAFSLLPLARARATPPAALFRDNLAGRVTFGPEVVALGFAAIGLAGLTLASAPSTVVAGVMIAGVLGAFGILWLIGRGAMLLAGRLRRLTKGAARIGLANLAGPRSAARTATPSIGLGVALLSAVVLIQSSLLAEVRDVAPNAAPSLVMTQIPAEKSAAFDAGLRPLMGPLTPDRYRRSPFATGRITGLRGQPVDPKQIDPKGRWAFDQDISLSTLAAPPLDANVTAGRWWPSNYAGPPLILIDEDIAQAAQLKVGDSLTLSILGRTLEARIAGTRKVDWGQFGASFPLILNPSALAGANLRDVAIARTRPDQDDVIIAMLGRDFPSVNVVSVREQLHAALKIFSQLAWAVRGASAVAALSGLLVLIGAITASGQARAKESAILKVLGAARWQILSAFVIEYGAVGLIAGSAGVLLGAAAAYPVTRFVFHAKWSMDWGGVAAILVAAAVIAALGGLASALAALAKRPAPILRTN
jgi:putative ABC transport system permease protein